MVSITKVILFFLKYRFEELSTTCLILFSWRSPSELCFWVNWCFLSLKLLHIFIRIYITYSEPSMNSITIILHLLIYLVKTLLTNVLMEMISITGSLCTSDCRQWCDRIGPIYWNVNVNHWLHRKLSTSHLLVQPMMKISSKWQHFRFSVSISKVFS